MSVTSAKTSKCSICRIAVDGNLYVVSQRIRMKSILKSFQRNEEMEFNLISFFLLFLSIHLQCINMVFFAHLNWNWISSKHWCFNGNAVFLCVPFSSHLSVSPSLFLSFPASLSSFHWIHSILDKLCSHICQEKRIQFIPHQKRLLSPPLINMRTDSRVRVSAFLLENCLKRANTEELNGNAQVHDTYGKWERQRGREEKAMKVNESEREFRNLQTKKKRKHELGRTISDDGNVLILILSVCTFRAATHLVSISNELIL